MATTNIQGLAELVDRHAQESSVRDREILDRIASLSTSVAVHGQRLDVIEIRCERRGASTETQQREALQLATARSRHWLRWGVGAVGALALGILSAVVVRLLGGW
uniref:Uncharacterized protein n=1 Tax=viral metagenome TaxID=1070528 RepID=A0A6M3IM58_9ZZZZ